jgi:hypothetical protein
MYFDLEEKAHLIPTSIFGRLFQKRKSCGFFVLFKRDFGYFLESLGSL